VFAKAKARFGQRAYSFPKHISFMPDDERILRSLQQEFKPMDRKYSQGELRVFGMAML
jgi:hypothetical protein